MIGGYRYARTLGFALIGAFLSFRVVVVAAGLILGSTVPVSVVQPVTQEVHRPAVEVTVTARKYSYTPARIEVTQGDIVKVTLRAEDIPHSMTIDKYRVAKRAAPGQPATFEILADQAGTFPFYCNLTADERCKEMRGELVVNKK